MSKILLSVISHRNPSVNKGFWEFLSNVDLSYMDVYVTFQDKNIHDLAPEIDGVHKEYIHATCQGDNRLNASRRFDQYDYVVVMDDDISRVHKCYQRSGSRGMKLPTKGMSKEQIWSMISDDFHHFVKSATYKIDTGYSCVMAQPSFFCEWQEYRYKDTKVTSCTQLAVWKSDDLLKCLENLHKYEYIKYHGDDIFYEFFMTRNGMKYTCDTHTIINTSLGNSNDSVLRPKNADKILPIWDILFLNKVFGNILYRKMPSGYYKPVFSRGRKVDQTIYDEFEILKHYEFTELYTKLLEGTK